jgi:hypothetical protein
LNFKHVANNVFRKRGKTDGVNKKLLQRQMRHVRYIEELVGILHDKGALLENSIYSRYSSKEASKKSTRKRDGLI